MRTFEEIQGDLQKANDKSDSEAMLHYAAEIDALGTSQATALASRSRGWVFYLQGDYQAALMHYDQARSIYEELGDRSGMATVNGNIGTIHNSKGEYPAAMSYFNRALLLYKDLGNHSGVATVTGNIGTVHFSTGDYPEALRHYQCALSIHEKLGEHSGLASVTGNIGSVYNRTGDFPAALDHFHRALALHRELGNRRGVATATGNIGIVHFNTCDYPAALSNYHRALALHEELDDRSGVARVTGNIGNVHSVTGDFPAALRYYHRALSLHAELGVRTGLAIVTSSIGNVHYRSGDFPMALDHYLRALALYEESKERSGVAIVTGSIVGTNLAMGFDSEAETLLATMDAMQIDDPGTRIERDRHRAALQAHSGDLDGAAATLQNALHEALEHKLRHVAAVTHKALRDIALKQNNLAGYVEHNNEYTRITEEIDGKETTLSIAMQTKQREIDAREREHAQHMAVLHSTLPKHIADRVARGEVINDSFDTAAVLFLDIVGFTTHSSELDASAVVALLEKIFTTFDAICTDHDVMKIKTIGDSYMAVAFPSLIPRDGTSVTSLSCEVRVASVACAMMASSFTWPYLGERVMFRIGLHSGPVVAGVLGTERIQFDVWGDTVNTASRMESSSEPGRIHVSEAFARSLAHARDDTHSSLLKDEETVIPSVSEEPGTSSPFPVPCSLRERGTLEIKGKGLMTTYWLEGA